MLKSGLFSKRAAGADSAEICEQKKAEICRGGRQKAGGRCGGGVKSHVALMLRHLKRFIDHFIDLISCGRAKIKLDTTMTFTAASVMNRTLRL